MGYCAKKEKCSQETPDKFEACVDDDMCYASDCFVHEPQDNRDNDSPRKCPYPHERQGGTVGIYFEQLGTIQTYWVGCSCGARGPWASNEKDARKPWNEIVR